MLCNHISAIRLQFEKDTHVYWYTRKIDDSTNLQIKQKLKRLRSIPKEKWFSVENESELEIIEYKQSKWGQIGADIDFIHIIVKQEISSSD